MIVDRGLQDPSLPSVDLPHHKERSSIKMVTCIIRPEKMGSVEDALMKMNIVGGITLTDVRGFGRQKGSVEHYMGIPYKIRCLDKIRIDMAVPEADVAMVTTLISQLAYTGKIGDGKIFVVDVLKALRIRTGEQGVDAL